MCSDRQQDVWVESAIGVYGFSKISMDRGKWSTGWIKGALGVRAGQATASGGAGRAGHSWLRRAEIAAGDKQHARPVGPPNPDQKCLFPGAPRSSGTLIQRLRLRSFPRVPSPFKHSYIDPARRCLYSPEAPPRSPVRNTSMSPGGWLVCSCSTVSMAADT